MVPKDDVLVLSSNHSYLEQSAEINSIGPDQNVTND
jgi:hypothetical protein